MYRRKPPIEHESAVKRISFIAFYPQIFEHLLGEQVAATVIEEEAVEV
jgi:hypothetical protein